MKKFKIHILPRQRTIQIIAFLRKNKRSHASLRNLPDQLPIIEACVKSQAVTVDIFDKLMLGTGAKIDTPKELLGKKIYVLVRKG